LRCLNRGLVQVNYDFPSPEWDPVSDDAKDLIEGIFIAEPQERLTPGVKGGVGGSNIFSKSNIPCQSDILYLPG
jgi:hypothetical protein